jgi:hypothetical protein
MQLSKAPHPNGDQGEGGVEMTDPSLRAMEMGLVETGASSVGCR